MTTKGKRKGKKMAIAMTVIAAFAVFMVFNTSIGSRGDSSLSDISLANIEALAENENDDCNSGYPKLDCDIWNVSYPCPPTDACRTGGTWKCPC